MGNAVEAHDAAALGGISYPRPTPGLSPALSLPQVSGKEQDDKDKQDESKPTPADHRSPKIKYAATEQEHQYN